jgi:hypothetical protein
MRSRSALVLAAVIAFAVPRFVPFGYYLMYPFTLLATWVHESGHGLGALATGGHFDRLMIFWDASGWAELPTRPAGRRPSPAWVDCGRRRFSARSC